MHPNVTNPPAPKRPSPWLPAATPPTTTPVPPSVVLTSGGGEWLRERLLDRRIVLARGHLDHDLATQLCAELLTLDAEGDEPVELHMSTPGADLDAALTVLDAMDAMRVPVHALAVGTVGGVAVAVFAAARRRISFPHATFRLTEPRLHASGSASELGAQDERYRSLLASLYARIAEATGRDPAEDFRRGRFLSAADARDQGLVTEITSRRA